MTRICHCNATRSRYIALKILCALPAYPAPPSPGGHPGCGPVGTRAVAEAPTSERVENKMIHKQPTPRKSPAHRALTREQDPGRLGARWGSPGGRRRGLAQRGHGRLRRDGRTGSAASGIGRWGLSRAGRGFWPRTGAKGASQEAGRNVLPACARGIRLQAWRARPGPPGHGLQPCSASARGPGRVETCCRCG